MAGLFDALSNMANLQSYRTEKAIDNAPPPVHTVTKPVTPQRGGVTGATHGFVPTGVNEWGYINRHGRFAPDVKGPGMNPSHRIVTGAGQGVRGRNYGGLGEQDMANAIAYGRSLTQPPRNAYEQEMSDLYGYNSQNWSPTGPNGQPAMNNSFQQGMQLVWPSWGGNGYQLEDHLANVALYGIGAKPVMMVGRGLRGGYGLLRGLF